MHMLVKSQAVTLPLTLTIDTSRGVVLDAQVDVLVDAKACKSKTRACHIGLLPSVAHLKTQHITKSLLARAPTEVAAIREVLAQQLVLLDLQASLLWHAGSADIDAGGSQHFCSSAQADAEALNCKRWCCLPQYCRQAPPTSSCIAFSPRTVTEQEIFSFLRMENVRTV